MANLTYTFPFPTQLKNLVDPVANTDAATKEYVDTHGGGGGTAIEVPPVYFVANTSGNNQTFTSSILASYSSNTAMTVFYNGSLLENSNYTLSGNTLTITVSINSGDTIDVSRSLLVANGIQVPAVYFVANATGNNQSFSNTYLSEYATKDEMTVFYNGSFLEDSLYGLSGNTLTVNIPVITGDTVDVSTAVVAGNGIYPVATSPAGSNTQIQFNNNGVFGASPSLTFDGTNLTVAGNLSVSGNVTYINTQSLDIVDPVIQQGGGANGAPLTTNDGKDRGALYHTYGTTSPVITPLGVNLLGDIPSGIGLGSVNGNATSVLTNGLRVIFGSDTANVYTIRFPSFEGGVTNFNISPVATQTYTNGSSISSWVAGTNVTVDKFIGWQNSSGNFIVAANVTNSNNVMTVNSYGTLETGNIQVVGNSLLGAVANVHITGGSNGQVLSTDGTGNLSWKTTASGNATPGGSNTQVQFNDNSNFAGSANFTFDKTSNILSLTGLATSAITGGGGNLLIGNTNTSNITFGGPTVANMVFAAPNLTITTVNGNISGTNLALAGTNISINATTLEIFASNFNLSNTSSVKLGNISNIHITGGSNAQVLTTDGAGNLSWTTGSGGNATPSGSNTHVQFNNNGAFGASANLTWDNANSSLDVHGSVESHYYGISSHSNFRVFTARGNVSNPEVVQVNDDILRINAGVYTGNGAGTIDGTIGWTQGTVLHSAVTALPTQSGYRPASNVVLRSSGTSNNNVDFAIDGATRTFSFNGNIKVGNATQNQLTVTPGNTLSDALTFTNSGGGDVIFTTGSSTVKIANNLAISNSVASFTTYVDRPVRMFAARSNPTNVLTGVDTLIAWDNVDTNSSGLTHANGVITNNTTSTKTVNITYQVTYAINSIGVRASYLTQNAEVGASSTTKFGYTQVAATSGDTTTLTGSGSLVLAPGDTVRLGVYQSSGTTLGVGGAGSRSGSIASAYSTRIQIVVL